MSDENKTKEELLNELYGAWEGAIKEESESYDEDNEYIANKDKDALKKGVKISHFYQTHVVPLPFWGNIYDPEYIVLSHNPSCEPIVDELESLFFYNELKNTLTKPWEKEKSDKAKDPEFIKNWLKDNWKDYLNKSCINWLNKKFDLRCDKTKEDNKEILETNGLSWNILRQVGIETLLSEKCKHRCTTTFEWWNEVFDTFEADNKSKLFETVGFFNICGYHSRSYVDIPQKNLSDEYLAQIQMVDGTSDNKNIQTIRATIKYVQYLIKEENVKIIHIWGSEWEKYINESLSDEKQKEEIKKDYGWLEENGRLIRVNKYNNQNKSLSKSKQDLNNFFKNSSLSSWLKE